jgi:hypothetical protein
MSNFRVIAYPDIDNRICYTIKDVAEPPRPGQVLSIEHDSSLLYSSSLLDLKQKIEDMLRAFDKPPLLYMWYNESSPTCDKPWGVKP